MRRIIFHVHVPHKYGRNGWFHARNAKAAGAKGGAKLLEKGMSKLAAKWLGETLGKGSKTAATAAKGALKRSLEQGLDMRTAILAGGAAAAADTARKLLRDSTLKRLGAKAMADLEPAVEARMKAFVENEVTRALGLTAKEADDEVMKKLVNEAVNRVFGVFQSKPRDER